MRNNNNTFLPTGKTAKDFFLRHIENIKVNPDRNGNGPEMFSGTGANVYQRDPNREGYDTGEDQDIAALWNPVRRLGTDETVSETTLHDAYWAWRNYHQAHGNIVNDNIAHDSRSGKVVSVYVNESSDDHSWHTWLNILTSKGLHTGNPILNNHPDSRTARDELGQVHGHFDGTQGRGWFDSPNGKWIKEKHDPEDDSDTQYYKGNETGDEGEDDRSIDDINRSYRGPSPKELQTGLDFVNKAYPPKTKLKEQKMSQYPPTSLSHALSAKLLNDFAAKHDETAREAYLKGDQDTYHYFRQRADEARASAAAQQRHADDVDDYKTMKKVVDPLFFHRAMAQKKDRMMAHKDSPINLGIAFHDEDDDDDLHESIAPAYDGQCHTIDSLRENFAKGVAYDAYTGKKLVLEADANDGYRYKLTKRTDGTFLSEAKRESEGNRTPKPNDSVARFLPTRSKTTQGIYPSNEKKMPKIQEIFVQELLKEAALNENWLSGIGGIAKGLDNLGNALVNSPLGNFVTPESLGMKKYVVTTTSRPVGKKNSLDGSYDAYQSVQTGKNESHAVSKHLGAMRDKGITDHLNISVEEA